MGTKFYADKMPDMSNDNRTYTKSSVMFEKRKMKTIMSLVNKYEGITEEEKDYDK